MVDDSSQLTTDELVEVLDALPPWTDRPDFSDDEWERFKQAANVFRQAAPHAVEEALSEFVRRSQQRAYEGYEDESKPFILMRVLFDLPNCIEAREHRSFKGWNNWPTRSADGTLDPNWPVAWSEGHPRLAATYAGSMGLPYAASEEYRWFRQRFPFR